MIMAPGFIDMHSHADFSLAGCPTADSLVHQGITTAAVGQCGYSPVPLLEETRAQLIRQMDASMGRAGERLPWEWWPGFKTYLEDLSRTGTSLNIVPLVGQGTVRAIATVAFLGPILYHSDRFLLRTWQRTTEALGIPTAFITVAVPLAVVIIFFHLLAQLVGKSDPSEANGEKSMDRSV
jgi:hypothetical protein